MPVTEVKIKYKDSERGNKRKATNVSLDPLYALGNSGSQLEEEQIFSEIGGFFRRQRQPTKSSVQFQNSIFYILHKYGRGMSLTEFFMQVLNVDVNMKRIKYICFM